MTTAIGSGGDSVNTESVEYNAMRPAWDMCSALLGGTQAMRGARETFLPKEPREDSMRYELRLSRSFLYNGFRDAVNNIVSKPFSRPVSVPDDIPEPLDILESDVDRTSYSLYSFTKDLFREAVAFGLSHIMPDFPVLPRRDNGEAQSPTVAEAREKRIGPILKRVSPLNLIGWEVSPLENGGVELERIRIREEHTELVEGKRNRNKVVRYVRVITKSDWTLYREREEGSGTAEDDFEKVSSGRHDWGVVPLITLYTKRTGFLMGEPPLEDLAWLNIAHWQSSSDQRNILRFARVGILFGKGFREEELQDDLTIAASQFIKVQNPEADLKYVEHSGRAIDAGQKDLDGLIQQMEVLGMQPFFSRSGNATATGKVIDEAKNQTMVQSWVEAASLAVTDAYRMFAKKLNVELPESFSIGIFNDFTLGSRAESEAKLMRELRKDRMISIKRLLSELKRRGLFQEGFDIEEEISLLEDEQQNVSDLFGMTETDDDDDDDDKEDGQGND